MSSATADSDSSWDGLTLTTIFVSAATAILTGIPTDFISEFFIFPFYHNSTMGTELVNFSSSILLPIYEGIGEFFGFSSQYGASLGSSSLASMSSVDLSF